MKSIITKEEFHKKYVIEKIPINTLAKQYGISQHKMQAIKKSFGYPKGKHLPLPSKEELIEKFINQNKTIEQIAKEYKVGYGLAWKWLQEYNIHKPKELLYKDNPIFAYCYKKGNTPWNKNIHKPTSPKSAETYFTRERIMNKTNYYVPRQGKDQVVVADPTEPRRTYKNKRNNKVYQNVRRIPYARYVLKQAGIEIPKGYIVYHVDGNMWNNDIGNLEIISRGELMKRNHSASILARKGEK